MKTTILCGIIIFLMGLLIICAFEHWSIKSKHQGYLDYSVNEEDNEEHIFISLEFSEDIEKLIEKDVIILKVRKK